MPLPHRDGFFSTAAEEGNKDDMARRNEFHGWEMDLEDTNVIDEGQEIIQSMNKTLSED